MQQRCASQSRASGCSTGLRQWRANHRVRSSVVAGVSFARRVASAAVNMEPLARRVAAMGLSAAAVVAAAAAGDGGASACRYSTGGWSVPPNAMGTPSDSGMK